MSILYIPAYSPPERSDVPDEQEKLRKWGLRIEVAVSPYALPAETESTIVASVCGLAQIDTGSTQSWIAMWVVKDLKLKPIGDGGMVTASSEEEQPAALYAATAKFPTFVAQFPRIGGSSLRKPLAMLLGRDILASCVLVYNGPEGFATLCR